MIPYGRQDITQADINAVIDVLRSDFITQGPVIPKFETAVAEKVHAKHAIAVNSGTSALHIACLALDLQPGGCLWTSPITFVASANCGLYCGANIDFVDIDPRTYNISPLTLEKKLIQAEKNGNLPDIVIPVHFSGQSCEMAAIHELSNNFGFKIIEDACHACGSKYKNEPIGNCRYSDITVFSFHPVKIITTAEGGMATTNDNSLAARMERLRSHGITRDPALMTRAPDGPWYYQQIDLGYNYRMTDIQAALGLSQLSRLDHYVKRRNELAERYHHLLESLPLTTPWQHSDSYSAFHLYVIRLHLDEINKSHKEVFESLRKQDIGVNLHYIPVHMQPWYQRIGFNNGDYPESEKYYSEAISLPLYPTMTEQQQDLVVAALKKAVSK